MARRIGKLPAVALQKPMKPGMHADGGGLYLQVTASGAKSWIFRFMLNGRAREMGLGPLHTISLAEARERTRQCRKLRLDGFDPIETRKAERARERLAAATALTFEQCAERYIAAHRASWRSPKHAAQWPSSLKTYAYPLFGSLPVQAVDVGLVMKALRADLADQAGDGEPYSRQDRGGSRLGQGARLPRRREPGAMARPSRQVAAGAR